MEKKLVNIRIIIITRSIFIITDPVEHLIYIADLQLDISEILEGTVNIKEPAAAVEKNQFINKNLNLEII